MNDEAFDPMIELGKQKGFKLAPLSESRAIPNAHELPLTEKPETNAAMTREEAEDLLTRYYLAVDDAVRHYLIDNNDKWEAIAYNLKNQLIARLSSPQPIAADVQRMKDAAESMIGLGDKLAGTVSVLAGDDKQLHALVDEFNAARNRLHAIIFVDGLRKPPIADERIRRAAEATTVTHGAAYEYLSMKEDFMRLLSIEQNQAHELCSLASELKKRGMTRDECVGFIRECHSIFIQH